MAFHNAFGPTQNAVTVQLDAAIPSFLIQESFYDLFHQWKRDLIKDQTKVENGHARVPTRPGLRVEVNEKVLEEHNRGSGIFQCRRTRPGSEGRLEEPRFWV